MKILLLCLFMAMIYHVADHPEFIPIWVLAIATPVGLFSYHRFMRGKPFPSRTFRTIFTLGIAAIIALTQHPILGRDPGIIALILLSTVKMMEIKTRRDFMFIIFMCYFLLFGNFLYDQSLQDLAFTLIAFILVTSVLLRLNYPENQPAKFLTFIKSSSRYFMYGLPFTIVLFLIFPRGYGSFMNLSQEQLTALSGFNDSIRPGQIAELAQANMPAFKVEFPDNNMPGIKDRYFRGFVLWYTDGQGWYHGQMPSKQNPPSEEPGIGIKQLFTMAPHEHQWLFALDWPIHMPRWSKILPGSVFQTQWDVKNALRYSVISVMEPPSYLHLPNVDRKWALQLPRYSNWKIMALAQDWKKNAANDEEIVKLAEQYFKTHNFVYTLKPGEMEADDPFADFLFNKRQGFCEHFAGAFAYLMRAAGVPTIIILGYQGGEYNDIGDYLEVKQKDAHAWCEVWIEGKGWQRADPTAWVSPERIEYGLDVSQELAGLGGMNEDDRSEAIRKALEKNFIERALSFLKKHWDNIKYKWDTWIISYDIFRQRNFLSLLGLGELHRSTLFLAVIIILPLMLMALSYYLKRQTPPADPLLRLYHYFCTKFQKAGLERFSWEGPCDFEKRALEKFPHDHQTIQNFNQLFVQLRYGRLSITKLHLKQLKKYTRKIRLKK